MARGDTVSDIVHMDTNGAYVQVSIPADEEWMITGWIGDNNNAIAVYVQDVDESTDTERIWFTDMVLSTNSSYIANGYGKWFFNPATVFAVICHNNQPREIFYSGIKTKDTS